MSKKREDEIRVVERKEEEKSGNEEESRVRMDASRKNYRKRE